MTPILYALHADYDTSKTTLYSTDKTALMTFGRDHHQVAKMVPDFTLTDHEGKVIATMNHFETDWTEAEDPGKSDP